MPFDGIVMRAVLYELSNSIIGGRIEKIYQPQKEEIVIQIHNAGKKFRLLLSSNASNTRVHITQASYDNPSTPPNFCILLRKYLLGGRITCLSQPGLERILEFNIESANEIGDITLKTLVIEVMGKHSNIILLNQNRKIIDAIKHIDFSTSRLREVLSGRDYDYPLTQDKLDPLTITLDEITSKLGLINDIRELEKKLVAAFTGISPFFASQVVHAISDSLMSNENSDKNNVILAAKAVFDLFQKIKLNRFKPYIISDTENKPTEYHSLWVTRDIKDQGQSLYSGVQCNICFLDTVSHAIDSYFTQKSISNRFNQKKSELIKTVTQNLEKCNKKINIQEEKLDQVSDRENLKIYGELLTANLYRIQEGTSEVCVSNYYSDSNEEITIKLDSSISPSKNAQRYFKKYNKAKSTFDAASSQLQKLLDERNYLESILNQLELSEDESNLEEIRIELINEGILKTVGKSKISNIPSEPFSFISSDGFKIMAGKNNRQNDRLTLKVAQNTDVWLHTRNIPGSHVIIRAEKRNVSDNALAEAAMIAAYLSKARQSSNVPVDYTLVRYVKKPSGSKPGFVIYDNFKTINVTPEKEAIEKMRQTPVE